MKLSSAQQRALRYLVKYPHDVWVSGTPVTQKCISVLKQKGLVKVCFDPTQGWLEKITAEGREVIREDTK